MLQYIVESFVIMQFFLILLFLDTWNLLLKNTFKRSDCKCIIHFSTALKWQMHSVLAKM
jgi:hypothetical protein